MSLSIPITLAEIGDKVGSPIGEIVFLFLVAIVPGVLIFLAGKFHSVAGWLCLVCFIALLAAGWQDAKFMLWDILDRDLISAARDELGSAWIWKMRIASWLGLILGLTTPSLIGNLPLSQRRETHPRAHARGSL